MRLSSMALDEPFAGVELGFLDWGDPAAAQTVVCVHGLTRNARDFDDLARALVRRGSRVISVDVAGRGHSSWLPDPHDYVVSTYVGHLVQVLARLGLNEVDWVGTSMGGLIGMVIADAESSPIRRLVLNDIGPFVPTAALKQIQAYLGVEQRFDSLDALEAHLRFIHAGFGPLTGTQWRHLAEHSARRTEDGWRLRYDPEIKVPYADLADEDIDLWALWDTIRCPTYVLHGEESNILLRPTTEEMRRRGPRAEVAHFAGVGHAPALMSRDQIFTVEQWLAWPPPDPSNP